MLGDIVEKGYLSPLVKVKDSPAIRSPQRPTGIIRTIGNVIVHVVQSNMGDIPGHRTSYAGVHFYPQSKYYHSLTDELCVSIWMGEKTRLYFVKAQGMLPFSRRRFNILALPIPGQLNTCWLTANYTMDETAILQLSRDAKRRSKELGAAKSTSQLAPKECSDKAFEPP